LGTDNQNPATPDPNQAPGPALSSPEDKLLDQVFDIFNQAGMQNIQRCHLMSATLIKAPGQPQKTLVRMSSEKTKINIYSQKKLLKKLSFKIFLNEDLTKQDGRIFKRAREHVKQGLLHSTWTKGGKVFAKSSDKGTPFEVTNL
jgi:hypothetical protein